MIPNRGELWSFLRNVLSQGTSIQMDVQAGRYKSSEEIAIRLDAAARERADEFERKYWHDKGDPAREAYSELETPPEYTCECGHGQDQHTKGPVQADYCRHCPCPKWTPVKRSEIGSQCSATNGGMRLTCPNCGHEPCAEWCTSKETKVECDCAAEIKRHCQYDNCECRCHSENR